MPSKHNKAGYITPRDIELFHFLFDSKVASFKQLQLKIFKSVNTQGGFRRLGKLVKAGFLMRSGFSEDGNRPQSIYSLTEKAYRQHVFQEEVNDRRVQLTSEVIGHDLTLVDIRRCFEARPSVRQFYTENRLQSRHEFSASEEFRDMIGLRSDAVIEMVLKAQYRFIVPVEYEATLKTKDRNHKKIFDYYTKHDGKAVLFICGSDAILNSLRQSDQELGKEFTSKLYFAKLSDVLNASEKMTFLSSDQQKRIVI